MSGRPQQPGTRSSQQRQMIEQQRAWLDDITASTGQTLTEIARAADLQASTLTRFRNNASHASALSASTILRIVEATGAPPPADLGAAPLSAPRAVAPRHPARGLREPEAAPYQPEDTGNPLDAAIVALIAGRTNAFAYELRNQALDYEDCRPGDILIVVMGDPPGDGEIVCAQLYDWATPGGTQTVFRRYEAPYLVAAGPIESARKPRLVDNESVAITGVVETILRRARPRIAAG